MSRPASETAPTIGQRRAMPDGGSQVWTGERHGWRDAHDAISRAAVDAADRVAGGEDPIHAIDAEQAVLGALLSHAEALDAVSGIITAASFYDPVHGAIFEAAANVIREGFPPDPLLVSQRLGAHPGLAELGGLRFLYALAERGAAQKVLPEFAKPIANAAARRSLIRVGSDIVAEAKTDPDGLGAALLAKAERTLAHLAQEGPSASRWQSAASVIAEAVEAAYARNGAIPYPVGLASVDALLGGFSAGELSIIAGRPGMGKSVAATTIAKNSAAMGRGTLLFSQEMAAEPLGLRIACDLVYDRQATHYSGLGGNPTYDAARKGLLRADQWARLREAADIVKGWPLALDTRAALTVSEMEAAARRAFRRWERQGIEPGPVVVDHLGIIAPEIDRGGSKAAETGDVSRGLAVMAKRLGVPVVALCQINRQNEGRQDKRPELADLRWSGDIEADARQVIFIYRPEYYYRPPLDPAAEDPTERAEREAKYARMRHKFLWLVAKSNNGPLGQVETFCDIACSAIRDRDLDALERAA